MVESKGRSNADRAPEGDRARSDYFLVPVEDLRVSRSWTVGGVTFHPGALGQDLLADAAPVQSVGDLQRDLVASHMADAAKGCIAEVRDVADIDGALDRIQSALAALRLFQLSRRHSATTSFGLPGEVGRTRIPYIRVGIRTAAGSTFRGETAGWGFTESAFEDWSSSPAFAFLNQALADPTANEGSRRAALGTLLLSRAATEHRPDMKMLGVTAALEAWLLRRRAGGQTLRLARHVTWFSCGGEGDFCGRDRPICAYLRLDPGVDRDRKRLKRLQELAEADVRWVCSDWHDVIGWYDARSEAAHGGDPAVVDASHASKAEYWVVHYLAERILVWLAEHPDDPIGALEAEIGRAADPPRWTEMLAALDSPEVPDEPPL